MLSDLIPSDEYDFFTNPEMRMLLVHLSQCIRRCRLGCYRGQDSSDKARQRGRSCKSVFFSVMAWLSAAHLSTSARGLDKLTNCGQMVGREEATLPFYDVSHACCEVYCPVEVADAIHI